MMTSTSRISSGASKLVLLNRTRTTTFIPRHFQTRSTSKSSVNSSSRFCCSYLLSFSQRYPTLSKRTIDNNNIVPQNSSTTTRQMMTTTNYESSTIRLQILSLYKKLLKAHSLHLPNKQMKQLGDAYVQSEFRLLLPHHPEYREMTTIQFEEFINQWSDYLNQLQSMATSGSRSQDGDSRDNPDPLTDVILQKEKRKDKQVFGKDLSLEEQSLLTDEQLLNLQRLKHEATAGTSDTSNTSTCGSAAPIEVTVTKTNNH